jgi:hypothetical protein
MSCGPSRRRKVAWTCDREALRRRESHTLLRNATAITDTVEGQTRDFRLLATRTGCLERPAGSIIEG